MKNILLILITVCFISCKDKEVTKIHHIEIGYSNTDTSIRQEIWYYKGAYVLQTVVRTWEGQYALSNHTDAQIYIGNSAAPYNVEIYGSFDYIKNNKVVEYGKAQHFIDSIKPIGDLNKIIQTKKDKAAKAINDSVELLKHIHIITTYPVSVSEDSLNVIYDSVQ